MANKLLPIKKNIMDDDGNDPIVIFAIINNFGVDRILVDDGSAVEVLIYNAFKKMNLDESLLRLARPIYGFANQLIKVKRLINLLITLGMRGNVVTNKAKFLIVDQPSTYNAIISQPLMKKTIMVTIVYCLTIKFPISIKVGYVKANRPLRTNATSSPFRWVERP